MKKTKNTLLWKITAPENNSDGIQPVSYLFGTMHVRDERAFGWLELALSRMELCEVFATEFDFSEIDPIAMEATMRLPVGVTLQSLLTPKSWKNLQFFSKNHLKIPAEVFANKHPMAVSSIVTQAILAEDMPHSLDETLWKNAQEAGKKCVGVETFAEQIAVVSNIPLKIHAQNLANTLKNIAKFKRNIKKMANLYQNGRIQDLYKSAKSDAKGMRKILLYDRNTLMNKRIINIASQQSLFCAVGAGHLSGKKGLLQLLKKAGFQIKPVMPE